MSKITTKLAKDQIAWLEGQAESLGTTTESVVAMLVTEAARPGSYYQKEESNTLDYIPTPLMLQVLSCSILSWEERAVLLYLITKAGSELETLDGRFEATLDIPDAAKVINLSRRKIYEASRALFTSNILIKVKNCATAVQIDLRSLWVAEREIYEALLNREVEQKRAISAIEQALFDKDKEVTEAIEEEILKEFLGED